MSLFPQASLQGLTAYCHGSITWMDGPHGALPHTLPGVHYIWHLQHLSSCTYCSYIDFRTRIHIRLLILFLIVRLQLNIVPCIHSTKHIHIFLPNITVNSKSIHQVKIHFRMMWYWGKVTEFYGDGCICFSQFKRLLWPVLMVTSHHILKLWDGD